MAKMTDEPEPYGLSDEQVARLRRVLLTHGSVYGASTCDICGVARCPDWVDAHDRLEAAGLGAAAFPLVAPIAEPSLPVVGQESTTGERQEGER